MRNKTTNRFILLALLLGLLPVLPLFAGAIPVGPNVQITDSGLAGEDAYKPDLAVVDNTIYAVWEDDRDDAPYDVTSAIYFAKSTDGGATWGTNKRITRPDYDAWADDPVIAVQPDGTIWIVWYQLYRDGSNQVNDIRLAYSRDGGETFVNNKIVVNGFDSNETLWRPDIVAGAEHVHIAYRYYNCEDPCNASSDDGYTIALRTVDPETLSTSTSIISDNLYSGRFTDGALDEGPAIDLTLRDGLLCAAWEDKRSRFALYGACSQNNGQSFGSSFPITGSDSVNPQIALGAGGSLYATYALENDARNNIWVRHSTDQGSTWSQPIQVTNLDSFEVEYWDFEVDANDQLLLAWVPESGFSSTD
ncbi:MAG: exo-alpha-sialidase, partial [Anaerolineae bacterium]